MTKRKYINFFFVLTTKIAILANGGVRTETVNSGSNSDMAKEQPLQEEWSQETRDDFSEDLPTTLKTNLSITDNTTTPTTGKGSNTTAPVTTKWADNTIILTTQKPGNNTMTPTTKETSNTTTPTTRETNTSTFTNFNTTDSPPSTDSTSPTISEATTTSTNTFSPTTETTPTNNLPSGNNYLPNPISIPTGWLYPGFFWPSSYSSMDYIDQHMSDETGEIIIEDFKESIVIQKRTIRKKQDKYLEEGTGLSQVQNKYGTY